MVAGSHTEKTPRESPVRMVSSLVARPKQRDESGKRTAMQQITCVACRSLMDSASALREAWGGTVREHGNCPDVATALHLGQPQRHGAVGPGELPLAHKAIGTAGVERVADLVPAHAQGTTCDGPPTRSGQESALGVARGDTVPEPALVKAFLNMMSPLEISNRRRPSSQAAAKWLPAGSAARHHTGPA